jgi:hypothetical protein
MTRNNQPEIEIFTPGARDHFDDVIPVRDNLQQRSARRPSQRSYDDVLPSFQRLDLGGKKEKGKDRRRSLDFEAGKITRRRPSGGSKRPSLYYEYYRFKKCGDDWTVADRIPIKAPQDELEKRVNKSKSRNTVLDSMTGMLPLRCDQVNRLLKEKNGDERDPDAEWVPVLIETKKQLDRKVLVFDIIIAQAVRPGGYASGDRRVSFIGERSDLREPIRSKSKDKYKDPSSNRRSNDYDNDPFDDRRVFTQDGRPIDHGGPSDGPKSHRQPVQLDPVGGPIPGLQPMRPAPIGWHDPIRPEEGPPDMHHNQPLEILPNNHQPHGGQAGTGVLNLDELLGNSEGGGGGGPQRFDHPRRESFAGAGPGEMRPMGPDRQRSRDRRQSGSRGPRPTKIYRDRGQQDRREYGRRNQYADSSVDDEDEVVSIFFDRDDRSSISSYGSEEHERPIERRGSLKQRPSLRRGEPTYREHHRRRASDYPVRRYVFIEPARTPRRARPERRQSIAWTAPRRITYPTKDWRDRDIIDEPLSPVFTQRSYSPGPGGRRESRGLPPELIYPEDLRGKDHRADDYLGPIDRQRENGLRRGDREPDEWDREWDRP